MRKIVSIAFIFIVLGIISGCTQNNRAMNFGGEMSIEVEKDRQFVNVTWKTNNALWVLTKDREPGYVPQKYYFHEYSSLGVLEGTVVITEK